LIADWITNPREAIERYVGPVDRFELVEAPVAQPTEPAAPALTVQVHAGRSAHAARRGAPIITVVKCAPAAVQLYRKGWAVLQVSGLCRSDGAKAQIAQITRPMPPALVEASIAILLAA
jgi:hypothetical protein